MSRSCPRQRGRMWPRALGWVGEWLLSFPAYALGAALRGGTHPSSVAGVSVRPPNHCLPPLQLLEGNFALFCTYTLGFRNEFQNILLAIMVRIALSWSPSGPGLRWDACCGILWVLPRSWRGMGSLWAEGKGGCGAAMVCRGDSDRRSPGRRGGRRSCQMSCKGQAGWQEQQGLCSCAKAARDGGDQEPWGPFVQILPLSPFPPASRKRSQCLLPGRWSKTAP